jgi:hypothetical protein
MLDFCHGGGVTNLFRSRVLKYIAIQRIMDDGLVFCWLGSATCGKVQASLRRYRQTGCGLRPLLTFKQLISVYGLGPPSSVFPFILC